jgi:O-antigen ligase
MVVIVMLPLQDHIPSAGGFSVMWMIFAVLAVYVQVNRPYVLARTWAHPVFLSAYVFLIGVTWIESLHPAASYRDIFSITQMVIGAIFIACLCRDPCALRTAMCGFILMSSWLSVYLVATTYGTLSGAGARSFHEATVVRSELNQAATMHANMNNMAQQILPGFACALALALHALKSKTRYLLFGVALFCGVAALLTMSRGGAAGFIITCGSVLYTSKLKLGKLVLTGAVVAIVIIIAVPDVVWQRMVISPQTGSGRREARVRLYATAIEQFPKYALIGIGAGNYYESWGVAHGFYSSRPETGVTGAHNAFFQATINWGIVGLLLLGIVMWKAFQCLSSKRGPDILRICLIGVAVPSIVMLSTRHSLFDKEYSLVLGLLVAARCWASAVSVGVVK